MAQMMLPPHKTHHGKTTVVMSGTGPTQTLVDLTSLGLPATSKCLPRLRGATVTNGTPNSISCRLRLASSTQLEINTQCQAACTIVVYWKILWGPAFLVQHFSPSITLNAGTGQGSVSVDLPIAAASLGRAMLAVNGATFASSAAQPTAAGGEWVDLDTVNITAYNVNAGGNAALVEGAVATW